MRWLFLLLWPVIVMGYAAALGLCAIREWRARGWAHLDRWWHHD